MPIKENVKQFNKITISFMPIKYIFTGQFQINTKGSLFLGVSQQFQVVDLP